jgi:hypothetical protein
MSSRVNEVEHREVFDAILHQLDFRLKLFSYAIAFNGALITIVFGHLPGLAAKLVACILGTFVTLALFTAERRAVSVIQHYADYGIMLEKNAKSWSLITTIMGEKLPQLQSPIRYRYSFAALYGLLIVLWIVVSIIVISTSN